MVSTTFFQVLIDGNFRSSIFMVALSRSKPSVIAKLLAALLSFYAKVLFRAWEVVDG
jgi:hypothetical protein